MPLPTTDGKRGRVMKLPHYQVLKVSVEDKTTLKAEWLDCVTCDECAYLNVQNTKYLYAICERHGIEFKPFEDDTRTHFCAWGIKTDRKTEPTERDE